MALVAASVVVGLVSDLLLSLEYTSSPLGSGILLLQRAFKHKGVILQGARGSTAQHWRTILTSDPHLSLDWLMLITNMLIANMLITKMLITNMPMRY